MPQTKRVTTFGRRRLLAGAAVSAVLGHSSAWAQGIPPTPVPVRIQTPDLAFVVALQQQLTSYVAASGANALTLAVVPAEPASDSLLNDLRTNEGRFAAAFIPSWSIPDLVRDRFIATAPAPPLPLPPAIARLRSFGGEWVAADFDHDCDLLFTRLDLLEHAGLPEPDTWTKLVALAVETRVPTAIPLNHAQQVADRWSSMAASFVAPNEFWFDPETMEPAIASSAHQQSLDAWKSLSRATPADLRSGSTGDLWQAFVAGDVAIMPAPADFLPFALKRGLDPTTIGVRPLPGMTDDSGVTRRAGNVTGANWGGVIVAGRDATGQVAGFFDQIAGQDARLALATDRDSGVTPAPTVAEPDLRGFEHAGWPVELTGDWIRAILATMNDTLQLIPLRIAETRRYLQALENHIVPFLASEGGSAKDALAAAADDWRAINSAIGLDTQRSLYQKSLMLPPSVG